MFASIRCRLTVWYFCSLVAILALFALGARVAMEKSVLAAVDHDLLVRIQDVQEFIARQLGEGPNELTDKFREQAELGLGGSLLQVSDASGRLLYRSARLGAAQLPLQAPASRAVQYATQRSRRWYGRLPGH